MKELSKNPSVSCISIAKKLNVSRDAIWQIVSERNYRDGRKNEIDLENAVKVMFLSSISGFCSKKERFHSNLEDIVKETHIARKRVCEMARAETFKLIANATQIVYANILDYIMPEKNDFNVKKFSEKWKMYPSLVEHIINKEGIFIYIQNIAYISQRENIPLKETGRIYLAIKDSSYRGKDGKTDFLKISKDLGVNLERVSMVFKYCN